MIKTLLGLQNGIIIQLETFKLKQFLQKLKNIDKI